MEADKANGDPKDLSARAEIAKVYKPKVGYPDLMRIDEETKQYIAIAAYSGTIRESQVQAGEYLLRIHTPTARTATGTWWVRLPSGTTEANWRKVLQNGKHWREQLAVLDEFSKNGAFSVCRVKAGQSVNAWEGVAAEQFGRMNPGQYLPGGLTQLNLEAWSPKFSEAVDWIVRCGKTGWNDLEGVGYAAGNIKVAGAARAERLAESEDQSKRRALVGVH